MAEESRQRGAYSPAEFSRLSGLSQTTVARRMDEGLIPELQRLGDRRFIPACWVERWLSEVINQTAAS